MKFVLLLLSFSVSVFALNTSILVSNNTFAIAPAEKGSVLVLSRGDSNGGFSKITLNASGNGVRATASDLIVLENDEDKVAVHDGILSDALAERRRTPFEYAGSKFGVVSPAFEEDSLGNYKKPVGIFYVRGEEYGFLEFPSVNANYSDTVYSAMDASPFDFAFDSLSSTLWIARGFNGLLAFDASKGLGSLKKYSYMVNAETMTLDSLKGNQTYLKSKYLQVFGVKLHPQSRRMWLSTSSGLLEETAEGTRKFKRILKGRITGVWMGGTPLQVIAESAVQNKGEISNKLWRSFNGDDFKEVVFRDTTGKVQQNVYDKADYSTGSVAFIGGVAFLAVRVIGGSESGLLKLDSFGAMPWDNENQWLYAENAGVIDRNSIILSVSAFKFSSGAYGLAVTTYGNGISVSADSGKTWTQLLNQASLGKNLSTVRMVPSVMAAGGESLVAYSVNKDSKITIEVFSYDMRRVRTIVKGAPRYASAGRSTNALEDIWDGKDDGGRAVTMGLYYVRVKDNHGHVGWGKVMSVGGN